MQSKRRSEGTQVLRPFGHGEQAARRLVHGSEPVDELRGHPPGPGRIGLEQPGVERLAGVLLTPRRAGLHPPEEEAQSGPSPPGPPSAGPTSDLQQVVVLVENTDRPEMKSRRPSSPFHMYPPTKPVSKSSVRTSARMCSADAWPCKDVKYASMASMTLGSRGSLATTSTVLAANVSCQPPERLLTLGRLVDLGSRLAVSQSPYGPILISSMTRSWKARASELPGGEPRGEPRWSVRSAPTRSRRRADVDRPTPSTATTRSGPSPASGRHPTLHPRCRARAHPRRASGGQSTS